MLERLPGYLPHLLPAAGVTILISLVSVCAASMLGAGVAAMRLSGHRGTRFVASAYVEVFRNTPILVQVFMAYYVLPFVLPLQFSPWSAGIVALTLHFGTYLAEIFRGGILGVDRRQWEAGDVLRMPRTKTFLYIVMPQAFRNVIPAWGNIFVGLFKATAVLSVITVNDLMFQARYLGSQHFRYFEIYTLATLIYLAIGYPCVSAVAWLESRLTAGMRGRTWGEGDWNLLMRESR
jgi:polar amino acid transport system permease protein